MNVTLDANIWVIASDSADWRKTACNDVLGKIASTPDITVFSPYLMEVEVLGSIARITEGDIEKINEARQWMWSLPRHNWLDLDNLLSAKASHCATSYHLRGADAVYVATALANNAILVTFDQEILNRASNALTVLKPNEWLEQHA